MDERILERYGAQREQLLNALYKSLPEVPAWESFLRTARSIFRCDRASLMIGFPRDGQSEPLGIYDRGDEVETLDEFCRLSSFDDLPLDQVTQRAIRNEVRPGQAQALILPVADEQGRTASLILRREEAGEAFDRATVKQLLHLAEPLKRGLNIYYRFVQLERRQSVFNAALETSRIGIILVDCDGTVLLTNTIADDLILAGDCLQLAHGKLRASTPAETADLLVLVRRQAAEQSARPNWEVYAPLALSRSGHVLPLTVIVRPGPAFHPLKRPLKRTAMLILRDPERQPPIPAATLARLFGLSPAESQLASELARGASLEEAAATLGISRNTVRSQLQSVFQKTSTNRQSELVRVLLSTAATAS